MNVIFINYHDFTSQSSIHIFYLANYLAYLGVECAVCVPDNKESVHFIGKPRFIPLTYKEALRGNWKFSDGRNPVIIHAWTPREIVRRQTERLVERFACPYMVHLEDNEESIATKTLGMDISKLKRLPPAILEGMIGHNLSHPLRYKEFLAKATGITVLMDKLMQFTPAGIKTKVIWPGYDKNLFVRQAPSESLRTRLGLTREDFIVVYTGNVHAANRKEVSSLYLAIGLLNRQGGRFRLIRTGRDWHQLLDDKLCDLRQFFVELGYIPYQDIPQYLSLADALVQPGGPNEYNDFRFPSKLTEFFGMGKPVVLPKTNLGRFLHNGENCLLLEEGNALEIADKLKILKNDASLRQRLGDNAYAFAEKNFNWRNKAEELYDFYQEMA